jgi:hypothetical protein
MVATVGRNDPCPCGSGRKFKRCCISARQRDRPKGECNSDERSLSLKEKNLAFVEEIAAVLQLDSTTPPRDWAEIKRACDAKAVRRIYEALAALWPSHADLVRVLQENRTSTSGLYVGNYDRESIFRGVTRHCLYADSILLIDPFPDPRAVKPEFSGIERPDRLRPATLKFVATWLGLVPWIESDLVSFVRSPGDFDPSLEYACWATERERFRRPELVSLLKETVAELADERVEELREYNLLASSDIQLVESFRETFPDASEIDAQNFIREIHRRREAHPYFTPIVSGEGQFFIDSSGTNYEMAKVIAGLSGCHLITDLAPRWREMELDREGLDPHQLAWAPFAKAFQNLEFRFLDAVPLKAALDLRKERRLESFRAFLRRAWSSSTTSDLMSDENARRLADELEHQVSSAKAEWSKIDQELLKWVGLHAASALMAAPSFIARGSAAWLGASVVLGATTALANAWAKRRAFRDQFPAGFFLRLPRRPGG